MMTTLIVGNREIECRLIVFDKDGTLIDLHSMVLFKAKARRDCIRNRAGKEASQLWEKIVGVDLEAGKIDVNGPLVSMTQEEEIQIAALSFYVSGYSWGESIKTTRIAYHEADRILGPTYGAALLTGVKDKLETLKKNGFMLAIASNDTHGVIEESFKALEIHSFFDVIVGSDDVTNGKPSTSMIEEILKQTGIRPEETVVIGDSIVDMRMSRNAGVKACIGVLTGCSAREKLELLADTVIESIAELKVGDSMSRTSEEQWSESE